MIQHYRLCILIALMLLQACSSIPKGEKPCKVAHKGEKVVAKADGPPEVDQDVTHIPNALPKLEPVSKYGNPPIYTALGNKYKVMKSSDGYEAEGTASWYGRKFHGNRTSSGEPYDMFAMTAAHKSLPLPTYATVKNLDNGREVIVKINDRGPFAHNRLIDLSYAAAKKLGIHTAGTGRVRITAIDPIAWHNDQKKQLAKNDRKDKKDKKQALAKADKNQTVAKADKNQIVAQADKQQTVAKAKVDKQQTVAKAKADKQQTVAKAKTDKKQTVAKADKQQTVAKVAKAGKQQTVAKANKKQTVAKAGKKTTVAKADKKSTIAKNDKNTKAI